MSGESGGPHLPPDHNERMANMRKAANWLLGDETWADTLMTYYNHLERDAEEEW